MLLLGDCLEQLKNLPDNSVDSVVTDPPYGLAFMGKHWDYDVPTVEIWREVLRVLKPGGHMLAFFGTRTYHRGVVRIEDAGFEIRDQIAWLYGSGFPKSLDISKAIDKAAGAEREVLGENPNNRDRSTHNYNSVGNVGSNATITAPSTDLAKQWQGWGTALKPANEPIVLARKPLIGTVAENVEKFGVGGLNIDESRIGYSESENIDFTKVQDGNIYGGNGIYGEATQKQTTPLFKANGRWPANLILDEVAAEMLDGQTGELKSGALNPGHKRGSGVTSYNGGGGIIQKPYGNDSGGASRFFYVAKASKRERNAGLEGMPEKIRSDADGLKMSDPRMDRPQQRIGNQNHHPTVKPIKLMQYLIKLVTPPQGTVLDPFMGSGSTGVAAVSLGFDFIGVERDPQYFEIAERRIAHHNLIDDEIIDQTEEQLDFQCVGQ